MVVLIGKPPTKIMPIATSITGDEKALWLREIDEQSSGNRGFHRYQLVYVVRDGNWAEFRRDLGPSTNFKGINYLNIPSLLEKTVDQLFDLANELRGQLRIDVEDWLHDARKKDVELWKREGLKKLY